MDQYSLKIFLELSDTLHFGRTSRICNVSPSVLSRTIQRLEDEVGERLFDRDNRTVTLTSAGGKYREYAQDVMAGWEDLKSDLNSEQERLRGDISIYCSVTACYSILPDILTRFRTVHPEIHIKLQTGAAADALKKVVDSEADLSIIAQPETLPKNIEFLHITETPLLFIGPRMECEVKKMLAGNPLVLDNVPMIFADQDLARRRADEWFRRQGIKPNIYAQVSGNEAILAMVRVGCGVGIVPGLVLEESPISTDVEILPVKPDLDPYSVGIATQKRRLGSPFVRAFWKVAESA
jgi:LysR family transcriptional regulator, positive regulator for ilvC